MTELRHSVFALLIAGAGGLLGLSLAPPVQAAPAAAAASAPPAPTRSALDRELFLQILVGEMELRAENPGAAYQILLDAARRSRDDALFRRATDIAVEARAGDQALAAVKAWRQARPKALDALRYEVQLLIALNRTPDAAEPLAQLLALLPVAERPAALLALPRTLGRGADPAALRAVVEKVVTPYRQGQPKDEPAASAVAAWVTTGRVRLAADQPAEALAAVREAQRLQAASDAAVLLAMELIPRLPEAETAVQAYLQAQPPAEPGPLNTVRLLYARGLGGQQRHAEALPLLQTATREAPGLAEAWLTLGALLLEMRQPEPAEPALREFLDRVAQAPTTPAQPMEAADEGPPLPGRDDGSLLRRQRGQALLMLSQIAEQRGDLAGAEAWLGQIEDAPPLLLASRRASLLAQRGDLAGARRLLAEAPAPTPEEARGKLLAEANLLRDHKRWDEAGEVLLRTDELFPNDPDVLYERAMMAEKRQRYAEMESLLRKVIALRPDHHHAYNALGYTLADRNERLPEAHQLITKALELSPGEPYLLDSLGWVEYRMGRLPEALRWLEQAYRARPDTEIGAHLGEVLWVSGQRDKARAVWNEVRARDAGNEVLKETLLRLQITP